MRGLTRSEEFSGLMFMVMFPVSAIFTSWLGAGLYAGISVLAGITLHVWGHQQPLLAYPAGFVLCYLAWLGICRLILTYAYHKSGRHV